LVLALVEGFEPIAASRRIRLIYEGPARLITVADEARLERVVANLLANALRFTPFAGTVRVAISEQGGIVHLEVADDGPGIPESDLERVFERSYRGTHSSHESESPAGIAGIGLATVDEIVTLHRGTVRAGRAPEGGALFVVELPFVAPAH
jgi:signal transduction histidine kinase